MWLEATIFIAAVISVVYFFFIRKNPELKPYYPVNNYRDWDDMEKEIFKQINLQRHFFGQVEAFPDMNLRESAEKRALHYSKLGYVRDHKGWVKITKELESKGIKSPAEILGYAYKNTDGVIEAWMRSDDHRPILLSGFRNLVGVGFVKKGIKTYFVCHFGR